MGKICFFAGHRNCSCNGEMYDAVYKEAEKLIVSQGVTEFWVGRYGNFDAVATQVVDDLRKKYDIKLYLVIPYVTVDITKEAEKFYDEIIMADVPEKTPARYKILKCNEYAVKEADFLIHAVAFGFGGAAKTLEYARKQGVKCIHIDVL